MSEPILLDKMLPVVGMRDLVYAVVTADSAAGTVYGTVKQMQGVMGLSFAPNSNQQQTYGDDGTFCIVSANASP